MTSFCATAGMCTFTTLRYMLARWPKKESRTDFQQKICQPAGHNFGAWYLGRWWKVGQKASTEKRPETSKKRSTKRKSCTNDRTVPSINNRHQEGTHLHNNNLHNLHDRGITLLLLKINCKTIRRDLNYSSPSGWVSEFFPHISGQL